MAPTALTDLPAELLDHITAYLPTANSISNLSLTNKTLNAFVEKDAWSIFNRTQFPSLFPTESPSHKHSARSLTALSRAWDRRACLARQIEPWGNIRTFPEDLKVDKWTRPKGQTIGYTPHLDVYEDVGSRWKDRREVLAFSAGAQICVRDKTSDGDSEEVKWTTYRPLSAWEGRDDVTTLHLCPDIAEKAAHRLIRGTANGDLQLLGLPTDDNSKVSISYFVTQGVPVRSSSLLSDANRNPCLLAANLGDSRIALYPVHSDDSNTKVAPLSEVDIRQLESNGQPAKQQRIWSTHFLSPQHLATGLGPSQEPIHIYAVTPTGFEQAPIRKFGLQEPHENQLDGLLKKPISSVYPIVSLPPCSASDSPNAANVFLSGAYDGVIRLHDLRSGRDVEQTYVDPTDDSSVYSILSRGREKLIAGSSRHSLLKIFDLRLGAKCYSYIDASSGMADQEITEIDRTRPDGSNEDWNLFVNPTSSSTRGSGGGRGGNSWSRQPRMRESSIYTLASSSPHSPYLYLGLESSVTSLAFTDVTDPQPDPVFFRPWQVSKNGKGLSNDNAARYGGNSRDIMDLAMYDQSSDMKLRTQQSVWETWRSRRSREADTHREYTGLELLDERWRAAN